MSNYDYLIGVEGETWNQNGEIALAVPPIGVPNSIPFVIHAIREDYGKTWCDVQSGSLALRIASEVCENYSRLADCVVRAHQHFDEFPKYGSGIAGRLTLPPHPHPDAEDFFFSRLTTKNGVEIVLIDKDNGEALLGGTVQIGKTRIDPLDVGQNSAGFRSGRSKVGRNEPCPCGSGKKFKKCCNS